jgi:hypothetical protein
MTPHASTDVTVGEMLVRGAAEHGMSVEDYVALARAAYKRYRTEQLRAEMRKVDGTLRTRVSLLSGISPERLDELGGVGE